MIGAAIVAILTQNTAVTNLVSSRITLSVIPQDQPVPCIYIGTDNVKLIPVRDALKCFSGTLEIGFQTDTYAMLDTLTTAVKGVIDDYAGVVADTSLRIGRSESTPDDYDENLRLHTRALTFPVSGQLI